MNYFPLSQKCELHSVLAAPHGPGNLVENDDVIYGEKFCLPGDFNFIVFYDYFSSAGVSVLKVYTHS